MGSRSEDLAPAVAWYLMQNKNLNPQQFNHLINHESGLLGISESSSAMRDLLKLEATDIRAAEVVEAFCYQVRKWIGAYAAALGGLAFLGIEIDENKNDSNTAVISRPTARVAVSVIFTNEELMIAKSVLHTLEISIER